MSSPSGNLQGRKEQDAESDYDREQTQMPCRRQPDFEYHEDDQPR